MKKVYLFSIIVVSLFVCSLCAYAEDMSWLKKWDGVELVLSTHSGPTTDAYKVLCKEFEQLTGAKVKVLDESWTDLLSKHLAAFAAHSGAYDVLTWPYIWFGHYVEGQMVENLDKWFEKKELVDPNYDMEDFVPAILDAYGRYRAGFAKEPDVLWSVPYKFDVYLAQYRTDLFKDAGLVDSEGRAKTPETWEELLADAKKLTELKPDMKPLVIPMAISDPMAATFVPILASYSEHRPAVIYDKNGYPLFHGEAGIKAASILKEMLPYMPPDILNFDYDKVNAQMAQGLAAYAINWNAYLPVLLDPSKSTITENVTFALTPGGPAGRPQGLGGWQMGLSVDSKNKEAAFQLLQFLTGKPKAVELALAGGSVARFSVAQHPDVIKAFPYYPLLIEALSDVAMRGTDRIWTEVEHALAVGLNKILLGEEDVAAGLKTLAREVYEIAENAGYNPGASGPKP